MRCVKGFGPHPEDNGKSTEKVLVREWRMYFVKIILFTVRRIAGRGPNRKRKNS